MEDKLSHWWWLLSGGWVWFSNFFTGHSSIYCLWLPESQTLLCSAILTQQISGQILTTDWAKWVEMYRVQSPVGCDSMTMHVHVDQIWPKGSRLKWSKCSCKFRDPDWKGAKLGNMIRSRCISQFVTLRHIPLIKSSSRQKCLAIPFKIDVKPVSGI